MLAGRITPILLNGRLYPPPLFLGTRRNLRKLLPPGRIVVPPGRIVVPPGHIVVPPGHIVVPPVRDVLPLQLNSSDVCTTEADAATPPWR